MDVQINWWAVLLAAASTMVVGSIWYAKPVFGNTWQKLINKSDKELKEQGWMPMVVAIVGSLVSAWVLAHFVFLSDYFYGSQQDYSWLSSALMTSFFVWLGFVAARFIIHDSFEGRRKKLTLMGIGYELATIMAMGLIIGLLKP